MEQKFLDYEGLSLFKDNIVKAIEDGFVEESELDGYVEKEEGKSLISNTEITRLASVDNYDDTEIKASIPSIETEDINFNIF